jgi:hypothetical protein
MEPVPKFKAASIQGFLCPAHIPSGDPDQLPCICLHNTSKMITKMSLKRPHPSSIAVVLVFTHLLLMCTRNGHALAAATGGLQA